MIGWLGSLAFGLCGLPQALRAYQDGHARGVSSGFLVLWSLGEVLTLWAVLQDAPVPYLIFNYTANAVFLAMLWRYKLFPQNRSCAVIPIIRGRRPKV